MASTWGKNFKISIFGESHGNGIGVVIDGIPSGVAVDNDFIISQLERRRARKDGTTTSRIESDTPKILSGIIDGITCGTPICAIFENSNTHSKDYNLPAFRPSHADYPASIRYSGFEDIRGGGHFSGRLTTPLVFAGALAECILRQKGISIVSHVASIHGIKDDCLADNMDSETISTLKAEGFPVINKSAKENMTEEINKARMSLDSVGGTIECAILGAQAGIGNPMLETLEGNIASLCFGIPAVKGIEFGGGFEMCEKLASQVNDALTLKNKKIETVTNFSGGIQGGITNGMPIIFRAAIKPTPSIAQAQASVSRDGSQNTILEIYGRHDPCIVSRASVVVESAAAIAMLDTLLSTNASKLI